jgi:outer membrane murein-binding lipoprotein Lpp
MSPGERTRFLSREFVVGFVVNLVVLVSGGVYAFGRLEAQVEATPSAVSDLQRDVAVLNNSRISPERIATLEQQMKALESSMLRLQATLDRNFYGERRQQ